MLLAGRSSPQERMANGTNEPFLLTSEGFGRYPHRNEALGRESTPEELVFIGGDKTKPQKEDAPKSASGRIKPMRILVHHGFRQNAHVLRGAHVGADCEFS